MENKVYDNIQITIDGICSMSKKQLAELIADKLEEVGFGKINVYGSGDERNDKNAIKGIIADECVNVFYANDDLANDGLINDEKVNISIEMGDKFKKNIDGIKAEENKKRVDNDLKEIDLTTVISPEMRQKLKDNYIDSSEKEFQEVVSKSGYYKSTDIDDIKNMREEEIHELSHKLYKLERGFEHLEEVADAEWKKRQEEKSKLYKEICTIREKITLNKLFNKDDFVYKNGEFYNTKPLGDGESLFSDKKLPKGSIVVESSSLDDYTEKNKIINCGNNKNNDRIIQLYKDGYISIDVLEKILINGEETSLKNNKNSVSDDVKPCSNFADESKNEEYDEEYEGVKLKTVKCLHNNIQEIKKPNGKVEAYCKNCGLKMFGP